MKALALFSGGLDSLLSMKLIQEMGIEVVALHFNIGFGANRDKLEYLQNATAQIGVELRVLDIQEQFFNEVLFNPVHGYGKYFNPCIDCHANMFRHALRLLEGEGASFIISGEVIGQRPKSQRREALHQVENLTQTKGLILRPLSAKLLPPTLAEERGWVDREKLLDIHGRGRDRQLAMAKSYGWVYFEKPGGGCLLTDSHVALKLKDITQRRKPVMEDIALVKSGRYLLLPEGARLVISRNQEENRKLERPHPLMDFIHPKDWVGPIALLDKEASLSDRALAGSLTLAYGKHEPNQEYEVMIGKERLTLRPFPSKSEAQRFILGIAQDLPKNP
ncbi:MAG: ATP-binding protein [Wolinella succinogenes]|uniref:argininosuccinate synthase domain-containing protein n=1 Tax=Wolinella succinogenes TaxID=844 RepID=UPI001696123C|nr:argininosuccinate synthase domain-containing protein [Wolinella succinogenes]NLU34972.1 ATP-binding protein [Wolinella succinogenes]